ncbi:MAG: hypothetical protein JW818_18790 [Pirellulales bacterium]|nr:hypothetical protein [Pirellulales bacterium]
MSRLVSIFLACAAVTIVGICPTDLRAVMQESSEPARLSPLWPGAEIWELALLPRVRAELGLDADQIEKLDELLKPLLAYSAEKTEESSSWIPSIRLPAEERARVKQALRRLLSGGQWYRLNQLRRQSLRIGILVDPEVSKALQLTPEQTQSIRRIITLARARTQTLLVDQPSNVSMDELPETTRQEIEWLWYDASRQSRETLSEEQRLLLEDMLGDHFLF